MHKKDQAAKIIRVITVPPVLVIALSIILYYRNDRMFRNLTDVLLTICFLGIFPILAYSMQKQIPDFKDRGREGQRNLAFFVQCGRVCVWVDLRQAFRCLPCAVYGLPFI